MQSDRKQHPDDQMDSVNHDQSPEELDEPRRGFTLTEFLGIGLVAGGLFNIPTILKTPETNADWMMLVIVLALLLIGGLLLLLPKVIRR